MAALMALASCAALTIGATAGRAASDQAKPVAATGTELLQLGLFATRGDAEWAWLSIRRQLPAVAESLSVTIDAAPTGGGIVLRARVAHDAEGTCRQLLRARFGCFVVRDVATSPVPRTPLPAVKPSRRPDGTSPEEGGARSPEMVAGAAVASPDDEPERGSVVASPSDLIPREKPTVTDTPEPPTTTTSLAAQAGAGGSTTRTVTIAKPAEAAPTPGEGSAEPPAPAAMALPVVSSPTQPPPPPMAPDSAALHGGGVLSARTLDGFIRYSTDDAKVLAEIERRTRRRGRIGAVLPSGGLEVTPAILTQPEFNICALTFDDGPHRTVTRRILEILNEEKVTATYFPVGNVAVRYPSIIRDWVAAGHEIGNHSYTHGDLRAMKPDAQRFEITETNRVLRELGASSILFRPPYGRYNHTLLEVAREEGSETVLWNVDTRDWKVRDPDKIVQHVTTAAGSGSVLLLHSTYPTTASALPRVIESLRAKNCEFVTLSDWIARMRAAGELPVTNASLPMPRIAHARN